MPLSKPTPRKLLHLRDIVLRGYEREDGLVDIEVRMTDSKTYSWVKHDGEGRQAGEALHDMWLRVTIGRDMTITACEAAMDSTPYSVCPGVAPNFARLVGLNIGRGFIKAAMAQVAGVEGCTHLRELLQQVGTVAFQTMISVKAPERAKRIGDGPRLNPALINTCHAYNENGPVITSYRKANAVG
jgi:hypothetical protein